jgi:uncharacterized protein YuzE
MRSMVEGAGAAHLENVAVVATLFPAERGRIEMRNSLIKCEKFPVLRGFAGTPLLPRFPRGRAMKLHYYPDTDSLYIELSNAPGAETRQIVEGLVVDLDADGNVVGFDIDHASAKLDLSRIETVALPPAHAAA